MHPQESHHDEKIVQICGTPEAVEKAKGMVSELLKNAKLQFERKGRGKAVPGGAPGEGVAVPEGVTLWMQVLFLFLSGKAGCGAEFSAVEENWFSMRSS